VLVSGEVTPRKIGWGVRPASQNRYRIYDQNRRYSTLFMAWPKRRYSLYEHCSWHNCPKDNLWTDQVPGTNVVDGLIDDDEKVASSKKNIPNSRLECKTHTLFMSKMVENYTLWGRIYLYSPYKGVSPRGWCTVKTGWLRCPAPGKCSSGDSSGRFSSPPIQPRWGNVPSLVCFRRTLFDIQMIWREDG